MPSPYLSPSTSCARQKQQDSLYSRPSLQQHSTPRCLKPSAQSPSTPWGGQYVHISFQFHFSRGSLMRLFRAHWLMVGGLLTYLTAEAQNQLCNDERRADNPANQDLIRSVFAETEIHSKVDFTPICIHIHLSLSLEPTRKRDSRLPQSHPPAFERMNH